jgi:hypothetical protein
VHERRGFGSKDRAGRVFLGRKYNRSSLAISFVGITRPTHVSVLNAIPGRSGVRSLREGGGPQTKAYHEQLGLQLSTARQGNLGDTDWIASGLTGVLKVKHLIKAPNIQIPCMLALRLCRVKTVVQASPRPRLLRREQPECFPCRSVEGDRADMNFGVRQDTLDLLDLKELALKIVQRGIYPAIAECFAMTEDGRHPIYRIQISFAV